MIALLLKCVMYQELFPLVLIYSLSFLSIFVILQLRLAP